MWPRRHRLIRRTARQPWALELRPVGRAQPVCSRLYASYFSQRGSRRCAEPALGAPRSAIATAACRGCVARNMRRVWAGAPLPQIYIGKSHMFFRPPDSRPQNVATSRFSGSAGAVAPSAHCLHPRGPRGPRAAPRAGARDKTGGSLCQELGSTIIFKLLPGKSIECPCVRWSRVAI
jgi:hypothetical protein